MPRISWALSIRRTLPLVGLTNVSTLSTVCRPSLSYVFSLVAGLPETVAGQRTRRTQRPFHARREFRELFAQKAA